MILGTIGVLYWYKSLSRTFLYQFNFTPELRGFKYTTSGLWVLLESYPDVSHYPGPFSTSPILLWNSHPGFMLDCSQKKETNK